MEVMDKLLEGVITDDERNFDYIHITEDDVIISNEFYKFTDSPSNKDPKADIIMTDMYVNIEVYRFFGKYTHMLSRQGEDNKID